MAKQSGITVQCVYCKARKTLSFAEAAALDGPPIHEPDGGPMVVVEAKVSSLGDAVRKARGGDPPTPKRGFA